MQRELMDQGELLKGVDMLFIKEFMETAELKSYKPQSVIFREGDPATCLYTLVGGKVHLTIGEKDQQVFDLSNPGQMLGWSSLLGRESYSATAKCLEQTTLLALNREAFQRLLEKFPYDGMTVYKNLAETLGNRLLRSYKLIVK